MKDERLAGRVGRHPRDRLEGRGRGDVDHRSAAALGHPRDVAALQVGDRLDIEPDQGQLAVAIEPGEAAVGADARVVDEDLDIEPELLDLCGEPVALARVGKIGDDDLGPDPVLARQFSGEIAKVLLAPRDQDDAVPAAGEAAGDLYSDPRGGAGDQRGRARVGGGEGHPSSLPVRGC